ncbi:hypothetical protein NQ314_000404 [Rhamnusium bicolor]|uniref:Uncharacterized protein n=1 Tax=Rhamnusium bicolor TaxID=1586634 RepID=A0AAV8ZVW4_9CUCU|nr:hypothetical protein NQ314_000404 [Rhamnusium bicolor]
MKYLYKWIIIEKNSNRVSPQAMKILRIYMRLRISGQICNQKIQECAGDKSKVQKQLAEIKTYIEYCQSIEEKVSEDQQERIKQITRKCKEVLVKFQDDNDVNNSGIKSPRTTRKNIFIETSNEQVVPQNKVALVEVEEKIEIHEAKTIG